MSVEMYRTGNTHVVMRTRFQSKHLRRTDSLGNLDKLDFNIKMDLKVEGICKVTGCCRRWNGASDSVRGWERLKEIAHYQLLMREHFVESVG
jgi:hypothetical protein